MIVLVPLRFSEGRPELNLWVNKNLSKVRDQIKHFLWIHQVYVFFEPRPQLTTDGYSVFVNYWELVNTKIGSLKFSISLARPL